MPKFFHMSFQIKKLLVFITIITIVISCTKESIPASLGDQATGDYAGASINIGGTIIKFPISDASSTLNVNFKITKVSELEVNLEQFYSEIVDKKESLTKDSINGLKLSLAADGSISLKDGGGTEYAKVNGKTFTIKQSINGLEATIIAIKK